MNEKFTNNKENEGDISEVLKSVAQNIEVNPTFKAELEKQLMDAHKPANVSVVFSAFNRAMPAIGWIAALAFMILVLNWVIRSIAPPPMPAANEPLTPSAQVTPSQIRTDENATPVPDNGGYDFRGAKLFLKEPLPESPSQANVYLVNKAQPATLEEARAFANLFGLGDETYTAYDYVFSVNDYYFTDGRQALQVYSNRYFSYTADLSKNNRFFQVAPVNNAGKIISDFLRAHGFDFPMQITVADFYGGYIVDPLAPDGLPIQYEAATSPSMLIRLDANGNVSSIDATLIDYDAAPVGTYGIISAQDALDKLLDDYESGGKSESFTVNGEPPQEWYRNYPDNQMITIQGYVSSIPSVDSSKPPFITIDGTPAIGNTNGMEKLERSTLVEATGQYTVENGIRKFNVNVWNSKVQQAYLTGSFHKDGDQIVFTSDDGSGKQYPLIDPPADLPLDTTPESQLCTISGLILNGKMDWYYIQYFATSSERGGGGGGGGLGFYQLNLSGTPVPFPTLTPVPTPDDPNAQQYVVQEGDTLFRIAERYNVTPEQLIQVNGIAAQDVRVGQTLIIPAAMQPTHLDGMRGMLTVNVFTQEDGSQRVEYGFRNDAAEIQYMVLEGENLQSLQEYANKPIKIWGMTDRVNELGALVVKVEKFEIPFPDLQFQILKGTEESAELDGKNVVLFTAESGNVYVEYSGACSDMIQVESMSGLKGMNSPDKSVLLETLAVPDLAFANYPGICVFSSAPAFQSNGDPLEMTITADQPNVIPESSLTWQPSNLTIDKVELGYLASNPYYQVNDPNYSKRSPYIQPVWHFRGHYDNGDEFDAVIQALKQEFLSPEISPGISPG